MHRALAIDPGCTQSAYTLLNAGTLRPLSADILPNAAMLELVAGYNAQSNTAFVIEMVASYGMAVGKEVFETVYWIGRFFEVAREYASRSRAYRLEVKMNLCHDSRAKDSNIRTALIDRFRPVGTKKDPGWFYGFKRDMWAAYAVAVTFADKQTDTEGQTVDA